jgi:hypothetical protein
MDLETFRASLAAPAPPKGLAPLLKALWHAARDEWDPAHRIAQDDDSADGAWVHAYLHRVEGDEGNAGYWYRRAGKPHCESSLQSEWTEISNAMLLAYPL